MATSELGGVSERDCQGHGRDLRYGQLADHAVHPKGTEPAAKLDHLAEATEVCAQVVDVAP